MTREALSGNEVALNDDALMPLIDDMLKARRQMCDESNEMFGTNISVDYGSTWHSNVVEKELVAESDLGSSSGEAEEVGGNENTLNEEGEPVSRLTDESDDTEGREESKENEEVEDIEKSEGGEKPEDNEESDGSEESKETEETKETEVTEETDDEESGGEEPDTDEPDDNEESGGEESDTDEPDDNEDSDDEHDDRDVYGHKRR